MSLVKSVIFDYKFFTLSFKHRISAGKHKYKQSVVLNKNYSNLVSRVNKLIGRDKIIMFRNFFMVNPDDKNVTTFINLWYTLENTLSKMSFVKEFDESCTFSTDYSELDNAANIVQQILDLMQEIREQKKLETK